MNNELMASSELPIVRGKHEKEPSSAHTIENQVSLSDCSALYPSGKDEEQRAVEEV